MDEKKDEIGTTSWRDVKIPLFLALLLGLACAFLLPAYSGPDENGHVAYVAALAQGHLPVIPQGEVADIARGISWQGQHPPFFYVLGAPFYLLCGQNQTTGLYALRALNVLLLLLVVALVYRVALQLMPQGAARGAAFIAALHPTLVYTSSMVNNELLAVIFSLLCVHHALRWSAEKTNRIFGCVVGFAGLALLTKLTAIAGVLAAAWIVCGERKTIVGGNQKSAVGKALVIVVGALALWLPWALVMKSTTGSWVPSPVNRPALEDGLWALTFSVGGWILGFLTMCEMSIGLLVPYWLIAPYRDTYYPMVALGLVIAIGAMTLGKRQTRFGFCVVSWCALLFLLTAQMWLRDSRTGLFAARYTPILIVLFALPTAEYWGRQSPKIQRALAILGGLIALATFLYIFGFFLGVPGAGTSWNKL